MKKILIILSILFVSFVKSQTPITDTISANSYEEAMDLTFGLLHSYPTGILLNKSPFTEKMIFADGSLNDSTFNMFEWYFLQNAARTAADNKNEITSYLKLDSIKERYIETNNILPFGILNFTYNIVKEDALNSGKIGIQNYRFIENSSDPNELYDTRRLFGVVPLKMDVFTLNPQFIIKSDFLFSNSSDSLLIMDIDLGDGGGFRRVNLETPFQASYFGGGYKRILSRFIYNNDTLYGGSELYVNDPGILNKVASEYEPYAFKYDVWSSPFTYPSEFSVSHEPQTVEVGVWWACDNTSGEIRKPFVIFAGYNPKDGKALEYNGFAPWVNEDFGAIFPDALGGWRGPLYETYNGFFTNESKNSPDQSFGSNGNEFLNKLRKEGYDVFIVRFTDGIGYLQRNAHMVTRVINDINDRIEHSLWVYNPGAAIDPEAPEYPYTNQLKKPKHEIVVAGYSAGALSSRMGLLLMEYQYQKYKCTSDAWKYPKHRTKLWIGFDCENQGSNTPIGFQMFLDFQKSVWFMPANPADIANSIMSALAVGLMEHHGVATQNTLYSADYMSSAGGEHWNIGHHTDFDGYFSDLTTISTNNPTNLKGYPKDCYRICVSQGSANGNQQVLAGDNSLVYNESPTFTCFSPLGTLFGVGVGTGIFKIKTTPYRMADAKILTPSNGNAFSCKLGISIKTFFLAWHINIGHWKYHNNNYLVNSQHYDVAAGSSLPSHKILGTKMMLSSSILAVASTTFCNLKSFSKNHHGFSPTVSGLDIHLPGQNSLPRLPNLSLIPGNVSGGLNLMQQNKYNIGSNNSPKNDFGYPHLTFPSNHYDYTPLDAIWANTKNNNNYNNNTMHVEDPNPDIGEFLVEEIAPQTLYLSNRIIQGDQFLCGDAQNMNKYYADFEARNSILIGNQSIYKHNANNPYSRQRTPEGDFIVGNGGVVTVRANNDDKQSTVVLGPGFSAKHGSIFRAYVYGNTYCGPFIYSLKMANSEAPEIPAKEPRSIITKTTNILKTNFEETNSTQSIALYPNPTTGSLFYSFEKNGTFDYVITDLTGKKVLAGQINSANREIKLDSLKSGMYLITISNESYQQSDRIILQGCN